MATREELENQIAELKQEMEDFELDPDDYRTQWDECLDENGPVKIGSLEYASSYVLKNVDETAYRCGLNDYVDSLDKEEDSKYKELADKLEELEDDLEILIEEEEEDGIE
jgi:hypothetical protein